MAGPTLKAAKARAQRLGFSALGVTRLSPDPDRLARLERMIAEGCHGSMDWLAQQPEVRANPKALWRDAKSALVLGLNYGPEEDPRLCLSDPAAATISVYARNRDYHELIKGRLKEVAGIIARDFHCDVKVFVDTAPVMEKPLARQAGLGWQGKHTNLVSRGFGSWLFLGVILTNADLPEDEAERDHCGSCSACLAACPTEAFPAPYRIDARRCISYLTIEHHGAIPHEFRKAMGNRIYGCDDCLAACPWNKFAQVTRELKLAARADLKAPRLADLVRLDDPAFRAHFSGSPIKRIGRDRFIRNVLIAIGNSGDPGLASLISPLLADDAAIVRGAAVWALGQLGALLPYQDQKRAETDPEVAKEWQLALGENSPVLL